MNIFKKCLIGCVGVGMAFLGINPTNSFAEPANEPVKQINQRGKQSLLLDKAIERLATNDHVQLAGHYSHVSHASHQSHQSHRSGY